MTPFRALCTLAGLSLGGASTFLNVRPDTVKAWSSGRNPAPREVLAEIADLIARQERAADEALDQIERLAKRYGWPERVEISASGSWPCEGARMAVIARVIAGLPEGQRFEISD